MRTVTNSQAPIPGLTSGSEGWPGERRSNDSADHSLQDTLASAGAQCRCEPDGQIATRLGKKKSAHLADQIVAASAEGKAIVDEVEVVAEGVGRMATQATVKASAQRLARLASRGGTVLSVINRAANHYDRSRAVTPLGALADSLVMAGADHLVAAAVPGLSKIDQLGGKVFTKNYSEVAAVPVLLGEAVVTGDISGIESLADDARAGKTGEAVQVAIEAGDYWAENGIKGGLIAAAQEAEDLLSGLVRK